MSQKKVYVEQTRKDIKIGILVCDFIIVVSFFMLFSDDNRSMGIFGIVLGIVGYTWYKIRRWWNHG